MEKGGGNMIGELNIYSCYSFQNSTILIQDLCKRAKELHMEALALTDINNMYGAIEFLMLVIIMTSNLFLECKGMYLLIKKFILFILCKRSNWLS